MRRLARGIRTTQCSHVVDVLDDPVRVRLALDELELAVLASVEEALALAEGDREDEQVVAVDEPGLGQALRERRAAVHEDVAAVALLELGDLVDRAQHRGVVPLGVAQRGGHDVLRHRVVLRELLHGRPDGRELVVADAADEHRAGLDLLAALDLVGLLDERDLLEGPARPRVVAAAGRVDDAVEADEFGDDEGAHDDLLCSPSRCLRLILDVERGRRSIDIGAETPASPGRQTRRRARLPWRHSAPVRLRTASACSAAARRGQARSCAFQLTPDLGAERLFGDAAGASAFSSRQTSALNGSRRPRRIRLQLTPDLSAERLFGDPRRIRLQLTPDLGAERLLGERERSSFTMTLPRASPMAATSRPAWPAPPQPVRSTASDEMAISETAVRVFMVLFPSTDGCLSRFSRIRWRYPIPELVLPQETNSI